MGRRALGGTFGDGKTALADCLVFEVSNAQLISFLHDYRWLESEYKYPERPTDVNLQIEFLQNQKHDITSWLLLFPQRKISFGPKLALNPFGEFTVKERHRVGERRFGIFGESSHHAIAESLVSKKDKQKIQLVSLNEATKQLQKRQRGIALFYPVRETEAQAVSIGFELLFPANNLPFDLGFTVRRKSESTRIIVPASHIAAEAAREEDIADRGIQ